MDGQSFAHKLNPVDGMVHFYPNIVLEHVGFAKAKVCHLHASWIQDATVINGLITSSSKFEFSMQIQWNLHKAEMLYSGHMPKADNNVRCLCFTVIFLYDSMTFLFDHTYNIYLSVNVEVL